MNNAREAMKPYADRITLVKTNFRDLEEVLRSEVGLARTGSRKLTVYCSIWAYLLRNLMKGKRV